MNQSTHFIIYAMGTNGDIDPMAALGMALTQRGYRVSFLTNDYFKPVIAASGCEFVSVGTVEEYQKGNSVAAWERDNRADNFQYYHAPAFEPAFSFMQALAQQSKKKQLDVLLITLDEQNGAAAAADKFNIPFIRCMLSPNIIFSAENPPAPMSWVFPKNIPKFILRFLLRRYQKVRFKNFLKTPHVADYLATRKKLDCWPEFKIESKALLQIAFFPEWFGMPANDWPKNIQMVGFPLQNRSSVESQLEFDRLVEAMGSPIIFTTGTGVKDAESLFTEGRKICEDLKQPGIFVGGNDAAKFLEGSAFCAHLNYLDFGYALAKSKAIVHHGGIGTTAQAIKAGIPQIIRPLKYDQPDNADRIYRLGLGTYVLPEKFTAGAVMPIICNMLQKAKQSKALKKFSADVQNSSAIVSACDLIEEALLEERVR